VSAIAPPLVRLDEIRAAIPRVATLARRTPVLEVHPPCAARVFLKCENMQPGGAFKIRGAANVLQQLSSDARQRGVITYSSGNHGQAVALAAKAVGAPAVIVMPTTAPAIKVEGVIRAGAEVILEGTTSPERRARAEREADARGLTIVPPYDHEWIIAGQGTAGLEILEQVPAVEAVFVPIGGGGLASGVAAAIKQSRPEIRVIGVEPAGANAMQRSLAEGRPVTLPRSHSIADGLLPLRPGDLTFAHVRAFADDVIAVSEDEILSALRWLYHDARVVVEPSGATAMAGLLARAGSGQITRDATVVAVLSGGNIAPATLAALLDQSVSVP
jgi:threonine dehydratase